MVASRLSPLIDSHAHLGLLEHDDSAALLQRAREAGLTHMVTVSTDAPSWETNRRFALAHPHVFYSVGVHPHDAKHWKEWEPKFREWFAPFPTVPEKCVAIGEMGMDFHYNFSDRDIQIEAFEAQLTLAKALNLPIIIHCRNAFSELFDSIRRLGLGPRGGVMHCFTGEAPNARDALDLGLKISFSGIVTFRKAQSLRDAAKVVPLSEMLVETDCPFLAPEPHRGKPNEPSLLPHTAACLAQVLGVAPERVAEQTTRNAIEFFGLEK